MPLPGPIIRAMLAQQRRNAHPGGSGEAPGAPGGANPMAVGGARDDRMTGGGSPTPDLGDSLPAPQDRDPADEERRRLSAMHRFDGTRRLGASGPMLVPHTDQFAARYGSGYNVYWSRFDESLRDNWQNALAMRRSSFIHEILRHRQLPIVSLPWHIEVDDPKDPEQQAISDRLTKAIEAIPRFQSMRLYLCESIWQGKYGSQVTWGKVMIDGKPVVTIVDHEPVDGDSIVYKFDKTPGVLVRSDWLPGNQYDQRFVEAHNKDWIQQSDRARALFLYDQFWRDHFIIQNFEPSSADFLFEGDMAAGIFGVGFRSRLYWDFQLREELRSWRSDALQRIGVNGMLYGFYQSGNPASMAQVIQSLKLIIRDNVTAFPVEKDADPQEIRHIEPSNVGYEIIAACVTELEESMRRAVLGQSLSSEAQSTGLGSEVAELHRSTFEFINRYDATAQQETLTRDMLGPIVRFNDWDYRGKTHKGELPFRVRFIYSIDKANADKRSQVIQTAFGMGLELDKEQVYSDLGLTAPRDAANVLKKSEALPGAGGPPVPGADGALPGADGAALGMPGTPKAGGSPFAQSGGAGAPRGANGTAPASSNGAVSGSPCVPPGVPSSRKFKLSRRMSGGFQLHRRSA